MAPRVNHTRNMMVEHLHEMGFNRKEISFITGASASQVNYLVNPKANNNKLSYNREFIKNNPDIHLKNQKTYRNKKPDYEMKRLIERNNIINNSKNKNSKFENLKISKIFEAAKKLTKDTGIKYEVHHNKPLSEGGDHKPGNLWILTREQHLAAHGKKKRIL